MTKRGDIYRCDLCGNIVEVLHGAEGQLVCCGKEMLLLEGKTADASTEKHIPYIEEKENGYLVRIGENAAHPMQDEHYIEWIELVVDGSVYRKYLSAGDRPEAMFEVALGEDVSAREYCNLHGLWTGKL